MCVLVLLVLWVPLFASWHVGRVLGILLVITYGVCQLFFVVGVSYVSALSASKRMGNTHNSRKF